MENQRKQMDFNFSENKLSGLYLESCRYKEYEPLETEAFGSDSAYTFLITLKGKGNINIADTRERISNGLGVIIPNGKSLNVKSDGAEPLTLIIIQATGKSLGELFSTIEKHENGIVMKLSQNVKISEAALDLITECSSDYHSDCGALYRFYEFIYNLEELYFDKKMPSKNAYMTRAVECIHNNYNKNITVESISDMLGIERSYLSRLFKAYKNKSTQNYIIDYRIGMAKKMFEQNDMNVSQVSAAVGYSNIYCFSRIFKSRVGIPPKEYMERCRKKSL